MYQIEYKIISLLNLFSLYQFNKLKLLHYSQKFTIEFIYIIV